MAKDYLARLDLLDFPPWHVDDAGIGTDAPGVASANVWPRVLSVARRQLADGAGAELFRRMDVWTRTVWIER
jgi:hypothetical protein